MAKYKGRNFLLQLGNGAGPEVFTTIGNLKANSLDIDNSEIDVTDKTGAPWKELIAGGIKSLSISGEGVFSADVGVRSLLTRIMATDGTDKCNFKLISDAGDYFSGPFLIAKFTRKGDVGDAETFSISLSSAGTITYTP